MICWDMAGGAGSSALVITLWPLTHGQVKAIPPHYHQQASGATHAVSSPGFSKTPSSRLGPQR